MYLTAGLQLSVAYESKGDNQKAIEILDSMGSIQRVEKVINLGGVVNSNSKNVDIDIAFQLGKLYYNMNEISEAKDIFIKIARINPNNSNARYSLGLIYEKENDYENALTEFEVVLLLNPENKDLENKIEKLKKIVNKKTKVIIDDDNNEEEDDNEE